MGLWGTAILLGIAFFGHAALWVGLVNRIHSLGMPRWLVKGLSYGCLVAVIVLPLALVGIAAQAVMLEDASAGSFRGGAGEFINALWQAGWYYFVPCIALAAIAAIAWLGRRMSLTRPAAVLSDKVTSIDIGERLGSAPLQGSLTRWWGKQRWNEILRLSVHEREFEIARLPAQLDGLSIAHLSDLHYTGRIGIEYFQEVARITNAFEPDLVAVTGDLVDEPEYIDWLPETLGRLRARHGLFFILGNHDLRSRDLPRLRKAMTDLGFVDVGGRWQRIDINGAPVVIAGNELPWIAPAADMQHCPTSVEGVCPLRILLAHSPDQLPWARRWNFDLMLAGHLHGGQICLPVIGPVLSPSWHGVKYAAGTFQEGDTLMHVSRGTSGEAPVRWNCPPELSRIVLRSRHRHGIHNTRQVSS